MIVFLHMQNTEIGEISLNSWFGVIVALWLWLLDCARWLWFAGRRFVAGFRVGLLEGGSC